MINRSPIMPVFTRFSSIINPSFKNVFYLSEKKAGQNYSQPHTELKDAHINLSLRFIGKNYKSEEMVFSSECNIFDLTK